MFSGVFTALITPFKEGKIDFESLGEIIENQIANGINGVVPCGTTGESPTLSYEEHEAIIEFCVKQAKGGLKVIAGTGSNSTDEAIHFTNFAQKVGCDGALVVSPYYNKPTQKGLYLHFKAIADSVKIPIVLYNIAGRTSVNIQPETIHKLAKDCNNIVAVKEASGSLNQMSFIKHLVPEIDLISGDDALALPVLSIGGTGVISVLSNVLPKEVSEIVRLFQQGDIKTARELHYEFFPLMKAMFIETNPIPVKTTAALLGMCKGDLRLPMCEMKDENKTELLKVLKSFNLI
ncbi:MAG: 4-hydroxy-tetrahydrodipicolinate synthase [Elusimicrobiota bacterium]|jgi:4-hydroxy-tetrahydrodipicolinate synthase|nr:4-hydroxy-tetrahydrodipicolinate synthase [Elusimicrobiota bacterium]